MAIADWIIGGWEVLIHCTTLALVVESFATQVFSDQVKLYSGYDSVRSAGDK